MFNLPGVALITGAGGTGLAYVLYRNKTLN